MRGNNMLGILFAYINEERVPELTKQRVMASVPFGGRYRLVDFPLSNMVNSGINNVGVITERNYQSLMDHLGSGKAWDLSRKREGLFLLPPFDADHSRNDGKVESLDSVRRFIQNAQEQYIVLSDCDTICNINYRKALAFHIEKESDITVIYRKGDSPRDVRTGVYTVDDDGRVTKFNSVVKGVIDQNISMGMFIIEKKKLLDLIETCMAENILDFDRSVMFKCVETMKVCAYEFKGTAYQIIDPTVYYQANMALMDENLRKELFNHQRPIYTKVRDDVPTRYGLESKVSNSIVASGCVIEGEVENCILFRGVKVGKGAVIKNSVIMQDNIIGEYAKLDYIVTDKNVIVEAGRHLVGSPRYGMYINKGSIV